MLGSGVGENGVMHLKILALDNRVIYLGSANVTLSSMRNREGVVRIVGGTIIQEILAAIQSAFADAMPLFEFGGSPRGGL